MRRITIVLTMAALVFALLPAAAGGAGTEDPRDGYIVVLRAGDPGEVAAEHSRRHDTAVKHVYRHAVRGYAARMSARAAASIARDPRVAYVEQDQVAHTFAQEVPTGVRRIFADDNPSLGIDGQDDERVDVDVAIIDTGLDSDHPDLSIAGGIDCTGGGPFSSSCTEGTFEDGNGHGTHVGGTVGAIDDGLGVVGVAPGARLWGVRVLDDGGSGYMSWIVAGIDWVTANAATIEVANMSLGCECSSAAMDDAITSSVAAGVVYAVAAGNSDKDASTFSPANHPDVITVSALADFDGEPGGAASPTCRTDQDDTLADFSNFGPLVELAAPGVCIRSTWLDGGYHTISGTSMASPHVAGAAALLASTRTTASKADVDAIAQILIVEGNLDWTDDSGDGVTEPLLDVSDATVFDPATTSTGGGDGGGDETGIALSVTGYKVKGVQHADLTWSGATSTDVDVYRNGSRIATTVNDGAYTDNIGDKGGGSYTYAVCEAGTSTCSNEATASF
jgi:subtilisin family serine protease